MVLIIGGGLAGLTCAKVLHENGIAFSLVEAGAEVSGRVKTTVTADGFHLDHGFQVLLDSYPAVQRHLDLAALSPGTFDSGAILANGTNLARAYHPLRQPFKIWETVIGNYATLADKIRLTHLATELLLASPKKLLAQDRLGLSTLDFLQKRGFSPAIIERFFRPFFGGVLIDNDLTTSAALFQFYFQKFITGRALLPASGIQEIPRQLASCLPAASIETNTAVERIEGRAVILKSGQKRTADQIVIAVPAPEAARLLGLPPPPPPRHLSVCYFQSKAPLYLGKLLVLPAGKDRLARHFCQVTNICPSLAPGGRHLLSATVLGSPDFIAVKNEIAEIYPAARILLQPLKIINVPYGVPSQPPGFIARRISHGGPAIFVAGDHTLQGSIQGAMESGEKVARSIIQNLP